VLSSLAANLSAQSEVPSDQVTQDCLKFTAVYTAIEQHYVDPVDPDHAIFDGGIRGMLSALDPFSAFFDRDQFELLQQQARGEALGFGSILYVTPGRVLVLQTAEGSPSWHAGLGPGDEIVEINGERVDQLGFDELISLLRRSRSHPVRLGVIHPGRVVAQDFELRPTEVALPSVDKAFLLAPGIGYLHLSGFEQNTPQEVVEALQRLDAPHLKGLLLDLRDNHGGVVDSAVGVASIFLKPGELVLTVRGRVMPEKASRTVAAKAHCDLPLVALVNGDTASAAEVLAAALQEHDRAVIAGEPTYGKGVVQSVMNLSEETGLALTTGQYFTPSGRSIQRPLPGTALAVTETSLDPTPHKFHTDDGRPLSAGGGITPEVTIPARPIDSWETFLDQTGMFTDFAQDYLGLHGRAVESFQATEAVLQSFKDYLSRRQIQTPEKYWSQDQDYLKLRIKSELFNLVYGLARGDEVMVMGDPQVHQAAELFARAPQILKPR
jgi:carboxyl-terminal processing protease